MSAPAPPLPQALPEEDPFDFAKDLPKQAAYRKPKKTRGQNINLIIALSVAAVFALLVLGLVLQSGDTSRSQHEPGINFVTLLVGPFLAVAGLVLYLLPTFVAYSRDHNNTLPIALINVVFGWTLVGWVGSLAWALSSDIRSSRVYVRKVILKGDFDDDEW